MSEYLVVAGMSGAGRSTAAATLEERRRPCPSLLARAGLGPTHS